MHIFISHSSKEASVAGRICELLEQHGRKCFLAPRDIRAGREYAEEIINGIDHSEAMLLLMSEAANESPHVLREVERAVSKNIPILVYKLEDVELSKSMEYFLMTHQWVNAKCRNDYEDVLNFFDKEKSKDGKRAVSKAKKTKKNNNSTGLILIFAILLFAVFFLGVAGFMVGKKIIKNEPNLQVGDTVMFGTYNEEPISWRVLKLSEDNEEAVLVSEYILCMKAYDAAEGGSYNSDGTNDYWQPGNEADINPELQVYVRGNSDWSTSNIRAWLNSTDEIVMYEGQGPVASAMSEHKNGYQNEPGFLHGFTEEEREIILEKEIVTPANTLAGGESIVTSDKVYMLSKEEMQWFKVAGISPYTMPTEAAIDKDMSKWYLIYQQEYAVDAYLWWLRTPVKENASKCYLVGNGYYAETEVEFCEENVGLEGYGIRPAITVDAGADIFKHE